MQSANAEGYEGPGNGRYETLRAGLALAGLVACCLAVGAGCATTRVTESYTFAGDPALVEVDLEAGDVVVTGTDAEVTRVDVALACRGGTPSHAVRLDDATLRIDARAGWAGRSRCTGVVRIAAPRRASIAARVQRGDVAVSDIDGLVDVATEDGDISYGSSTDRVALRSAPATPTGPSVHFNHD